MTDTSNPGYPPQRARRRRVGPTTHEVTFMVIMVVFTTMSIALNSLHHEDVARAGGNGMTHHPVLSRRRRPHLKKSLQEDSETFAEDKKAATKVQPKKAAKHDAVLTFPKKTGEHSLGDLNCAAFGGPDNEIAAKEMMYWSDIPSDADYVSPFKRNNDSKGGSTQYMTFEPGMFITLVGSIPIDVLSISNNFFRWWWLEQYKNGNGNGSCHGACNGKNACDASCAGNVPTEKR